MAKKLTDNQERQLNAAWNELLNGIAEDMELNKEQAAEVITTLQARVATLTPNSLVLDPDL